MIVTLRLARTKIKESQIEKGGIPPQTLRIADEFASGREHACERRARAAICRATKCRTPTSSSTRTHEHTISRAKLSTGYPQCCTNTTTFII